MTEGLALRYLQILNWFLLAVGAALAIPLGVVCLLFYLNIDTSPQYRAEFQGAMVSTLLFFAVGLSAAAAGLGQKGGRAWRWPAEVMLAASVIVTVWYFLPK